MILHNFFAKTHKRSLNIFVFHVILPFGRNCLQPPVDMAVAVATAPINVVNVLAGERRVAHLNDT